MVNDAGEAIPKAFTVCVIYSVWIHNRLTNKDTYKYFPGWSLLWKKDDEGISEIKRTSCK